MVGIDKVNVRLPYFALAHVSYIFPEREPLAHSYLTTVIGTLAIFLTGILMIVKYFYLEPTPILKLMEQDYTKELKFSMRLTV